MRMKKKRYMITLVCCLSICVSLFLTACNRGSIADGDNMPGESNAGGAVQEREWVYVPEVFTVGEGYADYDQMQPVGDTFCYVLQAENGEKSICRYSLTDRELVSVPIEWPEGGKTWDRGERFFTQDQNLYMTANVYSSDNGQMKRFLCRFDAEGNCLFSKDITEQAGRGVSLDRLTVDREGRIYIVVADKEEILLYTGDGNYHGSVSYGSSESTSSVRIQGACDGEDGKFYVLVSKESKDIPGGNKGRADAANTRCTLMELDFESAKLREVAGNLQNINGLCPGSDDSDNQFDLLLYDNRAVYGYRFDAQKNDSGSAGEELFVWMDSDINGYCVANLYLLEDGRLCATVEDYMNDDRVIVALKRTKAEQAPKREELVLATVDGGSDLAAMAVKFNRGNSRYHITVKNYESLTDLYNAILTKKPMDLIDLSGVNVQKLAARGLFEDLTPYVDQSEQFDRSDFLDGILDAYTFDNTLVGIPSEFMLRTVVGSKARLDNKTGLTLEELFSIADRYPGAKAFDGLTKEELMQYLMMFNEDAFIDWDTGVCHFDSEEFMAVLKYVSHFPDVPASGREEESLSAKIQKGEVLFAIEETYLTMLRGYVKMLGEDAACVGFPTADGRGGHLLISSDAYAIAAVSEHKESAWNFIEDCLTQDKGELYAEIFLTYPALKKTLNERAEAAIKWDEFVWDDINVALKLLPDATPFFFVKDDEIIKIINEEAPAFYSGQKKVEDVAGIIQNRIQVYVDENK